MARVRETMLPGVGVRHEFTTDEGKDLGVIVHHDGRREVLVYDSEDPDTCHSAFCISEHDTNTLAEILGVSQVTESVGEVMQGIEGMALEWMILDGGSPAVGQSIGAGGYRTETGASIVALIRDNLPVPSPGPDFILSGGDVAIVVASHDSLRAMRTLLTA